MIDRYRIKRGLVLSFLVLSAVQTFGQYFFESSTFSSSKRLFLELEVIDELRLFNSGTRDEFVVKVSGEERNKSLAFEEKEGSLYVEESFIAPESNSEEDLDKVCSIEPIYNSYELSVPEGTEVYLSVIHGNFKTSDFRGNLNLTVEEGIIKLENLRDDSKIKVNSGKIFVINPVDVRIDAQTNLGILIADQGIGLVSESKKKLISEIGTGEGSMLIRAILANIYLSVP